MARIILGFIHLVVKTSAISYVPHKLGMATGGNPIIVVFWHGQTPLVTSFNIPFTIDLHLLLSRHRDGGFINYFAQLAGVKTIRGSGATLTKRHKTAAHGGALGFRQLVQILKQGGVVALTGDIPKGPACRASMGIIKLAQHTSCPILPIACAARRVITLNTWDNMVIPLPFNSGVLVSDGLLRVAKDDTDLERLRQELESRLNTLSRKATDMVRA